MTGARYPRLIAASLLLSAGALGAQADGPPSIEDLTEKYRERSEAAVEALRAEVEHLLAQLNDHTGSNRTNSMEQVREKLIDLGSEVSPLLIGSLDPGRKPDRAKLNFSTQVALVLQGLDLAPVLSPLIKMAKDGSSAGRRLSIQVLGHSQDVTRVGPVLKEIYAGESPPRGAVLTSLARLGDVPFVTAQLRSGEREEVSSALYALATARISEAGDHVLV